MTLVHITPLHTFEITIYASTRTYRKYLKPSLSSSYHIHSLSRSQISVLGYPMMVHALLKITMTPLNLQNAAPHSLISGFLLIFLDRWKRGFYLKEWGVEIFLSGSAIAILFLRLILIKVLDIGWKVKKCLIKKASPVSW